MAVLATSVASASATPDHVPSPQWELTVVGAAIAAVSSTVLGGVATGGIVGSCVASSGKHQPTCWAGGLLAGASLQVLLLWGVLPELFRVVGSTPADVRTGTWAWARWPALALAVSVVTFGLGAIVEQQQWNRGQTAMLAGLGGAVVSSLTLDVLALIGATQAAKERR